MEHNSKVVNRDWIPTHQGKRGRADSLTRSTCHVWETISPLKGGFAAVKVSWRGAMPSGSNRHRDEMVVMHRLFSATVQVLYGGRGGGMETG